jgi:hypothetical protein
MPELLHSLSAMVDMLSILLFVVTTAVTVWIYKSVFK